MLKVIYSNVKTEATNNGFKIGKYVMTKKLGKGSYSTVYLARDSTTNKYYACKQTSRKKVDASAFQRRLLDNEAAIMKSIHHPNILHVYDLFVTENNYYLITDYCDQGDLDQFMEDNRIKYFEEWQAVHYLRQLMRGFVELRKHKILHRDLKLANIYVNKGELVIGDFGFSKSGTDLGTSKLGTPLTMAPEVLFPEAGKVKYNSKADLWSIGVIFYQLLFGVWPFYGTNQDQLKNNIVERSDKNLTFPRPVSSDSQNLLQRLLAFYPLKRIDWQDFFSHPIFTNFPEPKAANLNQPPELQLPPATEEIEFMDVDNFGKLNLPSIIQNVEEAQLNENEISDEFKCAVIQEVLYRYRHELNKGLFLIFSAHKFSESIKFGRFPETNGSLHNLCMLSVLKALMIVRMVINTIKTRNNAYKMDDEAISWFFQSTSAKEISDEADKLKEELKKHYQLLSNRAAKNKIEFRHGKLLQVPNLTLTELDQAIAVEMKCFNSFPVKLNFEINAKSYKVIQALMFLCQNSTRKLPYVNEMTMVKYDWGLLYSKIEMGDQNELWALCQ